MCKTLHTEESFCKTPKTYSQLPEKNIKAVCYATCVSSSRADSYVAPSSPRPIRAG